MTINVTMTDAKELVMDVLRANLVPFVQSSPGLGKSSLAKQIAKDNNLEFVDIRLSQMDPADLQGYPMVIDGRMDFVPPKVFPLENRDKIPSDKKGWLLLADEMNAAPQSVQAAAYRLLLDREVGQHRLHHRVAVMAAGNLQTDKAVTYRLGTAMQSRLVHFVVEVDHKSWINWADKAGIDHRVKSFINFKPELLHRFDPNHDDLTFPCPRTWEFTSNIIRAYDDITFKKLPVIAGSIGEGAAREFLSFCEVYTKIPTIGSILANPANIAIPDDLSVQYALSGLVAHHMTNNNADKLITFLERLQIDFQIVALRSVIAQNPSIRETEALREFVRKNAKELF